MSRTHMHTQTDRQTDGQTDRQTDRLTDRKTDIHRGKQTGADNIIPAPMEVVRYIAPTRSG